MLLNRFSAFFIQRPTFIQHNIQSPYFHISAVIMTNMDVFKLFYYHIKLIIHSLFFMFPEISWTVCSSIKNNCFSFAEVKCHKSQARKCSESCTEHDIQIYGSINNLKVEREGQEVTQELLKARRIIKETSTEWLLALNVRSWL